MEFSTLRLPTSCLIRHRCRRSRTARRSKSIRRRRSVTGASPSTCHSPIGAMPNRHITTVSALPTIIWFSRSGRSAARSPTSSRLRRRRWVRRATGNLSRAGRPTSGRRTISAFKCPEGTTDSIKWGIKLVGVCIDKVCGSWDNQDVGFGDMVAAGYTPGDFIVQLCVPREEEVCFHCHTDNVSATPFRCSTTARHPFRSGRRARVMCRLSST